MRFIKTQREKELIEDDNYLYKKIIWGENLEDGAVEYEHAKAL